MRLQNVRDEEGGTINEPNDGEKPSTAYSLGPKMEGRVQRLRDKLTGPDEPPAETGTVFSAALALMESVADWGAEGRVAVVEPAGGGEFRLYGVDRGDLQQAFELWEEENGGDDVSD